MYSNSRIGRESQWVNGVPLRCLLQARFDVGGDQVSLGGVPPGNGCGRGMMLWT